MRYELNENKELVKIEEAVRDLITKKEVEENSVFFKNGEKELEVWKGSDKKYYVSLKNILSMDGISKQDKNWTKVKEYILLRIEMYNLEKVV